MFGVEDFDWLFKDSIKAIFSHKDRFEHAHLSYDPMYPSYIQVPKANSIFNKA